MNPTNKLSYFIICMLLLIGACRNPVEPVEPQGFTYADESDLGDEIHEAMVGSSLFEVLTGNPGDTYHAAYQYLSGLRVKIIATNLLERRQDFDWKIYIIKNDDLQSCFTTVGGKIYVTTGLLRDMVANEAELLGVLAHEMYYADHSYHMELIDANYDFKVIYDVMTGGVEDRALEMLGSFYNTPRDPNLVPQADQFGANILCAIGDLSITAFGNVIENAAVTNPTPRWYTNHPTPSNSSITDRKGELQAIEFNCAGSSPNLYQDRYLDFLNNLPPR